MVYDLQVGAIGAVITIGLAEDGVAIDLTNATTIDMILKGPRGPARVRTASVVGSAANGVVQYATVAGDVAHAGRLSVQVHVEFDGGTTEFWSSVEEFDVGANL